MNELSDPGMRAFIEETAKFYPADAIEHSVAEQRACYDKLCAHFMKPYPSGITSTDFEISSVPVRHYKPSSPSADTAIVYAHGGGFVVGGLHSHDDICAEIADYANAELIAVDYRLAPEHIFPAAFDDCWTVLEWAAEKFDRFVVAGDSAGAKLSASLVLKARDLGLKQIAGQALVYGGFGGEPEGGSYVTNAEAPGLATQDVKFYGEVYFGKPPNPNWNNKFARPRLETDYSGLPPAFIVAAGIDPLLDESTAYAEALRQAGVDVDLRIEPDLIHGYLRARHMSDPAGKSFEAICHAIKEFCHGGR